MTEWISVKDRLPEVANVRQMGWHKGQGIVRFCKWAFAFSPRWSMDWKRRHPLDAAARAAEGRRTQCHLT